MKMHVRHTLLLWSLVVPYLLLVQHKRTVTVLLFCSTFSLPLRSSLVLARTIYVRCIYGTFGREITKYTVIYGV